MAALCDSNVHKVCEQNISLHIDKFFWKNGIINDLFLLAFHTREVQIYALNDHWS
jgi:hypothetical protein